MGSQGSGGRSWAPFRLELLLAGEIQGLQKPPEHVQSFHTGSPCSRLHIVHPPSSVWLTPSTRRPRAQFLWLLSLRGLGLPCRSALFRITCLLFFPSGSSASSSTMYIFPCFRIPSFQCLVAPSQASLLGLRLMDLPFPPLPVSTPTTLYPSGFAAYVALDIPPFSVGARGCLDQNDIKAPNLGNIRRPVRDCCDEQSAPSPLIPGNCG